MKIRSGYKGSNGLDKEFIESLHEDRNYVLFSPLNEELCNYSLPMRYLLAKLIKSDKENFQTIKETYINNLSDFEKKRLEEENESFFLNRLKNILREKSKHTKSFIKDIQKDKLSRAVKSYIKAHKKMTVAEKKREVVSTALLKKNINGYDLFKLSDYQFKNIISQSDEKELKDLMELSCLYGNSIKLKIVLNTLTNKKGTFSETEYEKLNAILFYSLAKGLLIFEDIEEIIFNDILLLASVPKQYMLNVLEFSETEKDELIERLDNTHFIFNQGSDRLSRKEDPINAKQVILNQKNMFNGHYIIAGQAGTGKTQSIQSVIKKIKAEEEFESNRQIIKIKSEQYLLSGEIKNTNLSRPVKNRL